MGISNSVITLSVARYSSLSYRIVQRFYALKDVNWLLVNLFLWFSDNFCGDTGQTDRSDPKNAKRCFIFDLILPYQGEQPGIGRPKTLGYKVKLDNLDEKYYISKIQDKNSDVSTKVYQFEDFTPKMAGLKLNIVVMIHTGQSH